MSTATAPIDIIRRQFPKWQPATAAEIAEWEEALERYPESVLERAAAKHKIDSGRFTSPKLGDVLKLCRGLNSGNAAPREEHPIPLLAFIHRNHPKAKALPDVEALIRWFRNQWQYVLFRTGVGDNAPDVSQLRRDENRALRRGFVEQDCIGYLMQTGNYKTREQAAEHAAVCFVEERDFTHALDYAMGRAAQDPF